MLAVTEIVLKLKWFEYFCPFKEKKFWEVWTKKNYYPGFDNLKLWTSDTLYQISTSHKFSTFSPSKCSDPFWSLISSLWSVILVFHTKSLNFHSYFWNCDIHQCLFFSIRSLNIETLLLWKVYWSFNFILVNWWKHFVFVLYLLSKRYI